jgi:hypothetical protein
MTAIKLDQVADTKFGQKRIGRRPRRRVCKVFYDVHDDIAGHTVSVWHSCFFQLAPLSIFNFATQKVDRLLSDVLNIRVRC